MPDSRAPNRWLFVLIPVLLLVIVASGVSLWLRFPRSHTIEIALPPSEKFYSEVYVGGAVANPGIYPVKADDSIAGLLQSAGGVTGSADRAKLSLSVPMIVSTREPQKIDINRAEAWLLKALPDIGDTRAKAITDYRDKNGLFRNVYELTRVEGISAPTYEKIKTLVTVSDW